MKVPCKECGAVIDFPDGIPVRFGVLCAGCMKRSEVEAEQLRRARKDACWGARWYDICPSRFHDTQHLLLPRPDQSMRALRWQRNGGGGLNLWGFPNTGKTRTMLLVLKREHFKGVSVRLLMAGQFERELEKRAWKRAPWLEQLIRCDVLAFDDFDKLNLTKEQERVFFSLMDARMNQKLPVLLTHNSTASELEYRFRCGESLVRRIRDFCESIHFPTIT